MTFEMFEVGGAVRDSLLGIDSKDVDFACVAHDPQQFATAADAFTELEAHLSSAGFKVFLTTPEFLTIRAQVPNGHVLKQRTNVADFVLARRDGPSADGRRPDFVLPGTLQDDLSRRDFTINAMALNPQTQELIDPFNGRHDLETRTIRFVGDAMQRIEEDGLRILRALRFSVTKGFMLSTDTHELLRDMNSDQIEFLMRSVSVERMREELVKMFTHDTLHAMNVLTQFDVLRVFLFDTMNIKLLPTLKQF